MTAWLNCLEYKPTCQLRLSSNTSIFYLSSVCMHSLTLYHLSGSWTLFRRKSEHLTLLCPSDLLLKLSSSSLSCPNNVVRVCARARTSVCVPVCVYVISMFACFYWMGDVLQWTNGTQRICNYYYHQSPTVQLKSINGDLNFGASKRKELKKQERKKKKRKKKRKRLSPAFWRKKMKKNTFFKWEIQNCVQIYSRWPWQKV